MISYSPLSIPLSSSRKSVTLIRRDLFDARFQLISESHGAGDSTSTNEACDSEKNSQVEVDDKALGFLDNPSDLVPGVYEGGLKTWECSLDLVDYLDSLKDRSDFQGFYGRKVLEVIITHSLSCLEVEVFHALTAWVWHRCPLTLCLSGALVIFLRRQFCE